MDGYYDFFKKVMFSLGIESDTRSKYPILMTLLRFSTVVLITMLIIQSFLYFIHDDKNNAYLTVASVSQVFFVIQGLVKLMTVILKNDQLLVIINRLKKVYLEMDKLERTKSSKFLRKMSKFCFYVFVMQMCCVWIFNFLPIFSFLAAFFRGTEYKRFFPHAVWWPFDPYEYYIPVFLFELYLGHLMMVVQNIFDIYFVLIVADVATHFNRLSERFKRIINEYDKLKIEITRKKLHGCLKLHNELIELFDELNGIFQFALLVQIVFSSFVVCFIGIIIISLDLFYAIPTSFAMCTTLSQTLLPCYFGEMMSESSTRVADEILSSDFYNLDQKLQKELIFIIQSAQKAKTLKASKFFVLSLSGYTTIIKTAFSYITVARKAFH